MAVPLRRIRIYRDRRLGVNGARQRDRRDHCWQIEGCAPARRAACHAFIVQENCWDFWAVRGAKNRDCCHKLDDCRQCPLAQQKFSEELPVHMRTPPAAAAPAIPLVCAHLRFTEGALPRGRDLYVFMRHQIREDRDVFRCCKRGVHLDPCWVGDVCAVRAGRDCVFLA